MELLLLLLSLFVDVNDTDDCNELHGSGEQVPVSSLLLLLLLFVSISLFFLSANLVSDRLIMLLLRTSHRSIAEFFFVREKIKVYELYGTLIVVIVVAVLSDDDKDK